MIQAPGTWCEIKRPIITRLADRKKMRCGCGRRLMLQTVLHGEVTGDVEGYRIPPHKTPPRRFRRAKGDRGSRCLPRR